MISIKFLPDHASSRLFATVIVLAVYISSAIAQTTKNGQLRMTKEEVLSAKSDEPVAPGSSNIKGIQVIVIHGDPSSKGLYTILLKVPANTKIAAHLHPDDRVATVISGTWYFGYGDIFDKSKLRKLTSGSIYTEVEGQNHFAKTGNEPVVAEITGYGPSGVTYVNAADDPKNK